MKLFLDDERETPEGWFRVYTPEHTIQILKTGWVTHLSLDHDLGNDEGVGTGYDVLNWIEAALYFRILKEVPYISIHSDNSSARVKMKLAIENIWRMADEQKEREESS